MGLEERRARALELLAKSASELMQFWTLGLRPLDRLGLQATMAMIVGISRWDSSP
jgi:hypothetical protein